MRKRMGMDNLDHCSDNGTCIRVCVLEQVEHQIDGKPRAAGVMSKIRVDEEWNGVEAVFHDTEAHGSHATVFASLDARLVCPGGKLNLNRSDGDANAEVCDA